MRAVLPVVHEGVEWVLGAAAAAVAVAALNRRGQVRRSRPGRRLVVRPSLHRPARCSQPRLSHRRARPCRVQ